ncbi:MAG: hypothetical protein JWL86_5411 [Rhizobium sp.]|nr:hypothetical protein [Rhizobium sp.]
MADSIWKIAKDQIYATLGRDALLTPEGQDGTIALRVIDKTKGVADMAGGAIIELNTARPAATVRMSELIEKNLDLDEDVQGGKIEFNNRCWVVKSHQPKPSSQGIDAGEAYLFLSRP